MSDDKWKTLREFVKDEYFKASDKDDMDRADIFHEVLDEMNRLEGQSHDRT